jgi:hypothetical protein
MGRNRGYHGQKTRQLREARIVERRARVAERVFKDPKQRVTHTEVAMELGVDRGTVRNDLKHIMNDISEDTQALAIDYRNKEIRLLERARAEAWDAWQASKGIHKKKKQEAMGTVDEETKTIVPSKSVKLTEEEEHSHGDPKYLALYLAIHDRLAKLLKLVDERPGEGIGGDPGYIDANAIIIQDVSPNGKSRH